MWVVAGVMWRDLCAPADRYIERDLVLSFFFSFLFSFLFFFVCVCVCVRALALLARKEKIDTWDALIYRLPS